MILAHHGNNHPKQGMVIIGGRAYKTVVIGNRVWLAENLQLTWSGLDVSTAQNPITGVVSTPTAWYYNDDEASYSLDGTKPCGLLYNGAAFEYLDNNPGLLPAGWRLPNYSDFNNLYATNAGNDTAHLKKVDGAFGGVWPSGWNGDDSLGFGMVPTGSRSSSGSFNGLNLSTSARSSYKQNGNYTYIYVTTSNTIYFYEETYYNTARPIRLVKDA